MRRRFITPANWDEIFGHVGEFRVLTRDKLAAPGTHDGLQLPDGSVVHLTANGPEGCSYEQFKQGKEPKVVREVGMECYGQIMENVRIALSERRPYHFIDWNCERFARWLLGEPADSPQVTGWFILGVVAAVAAAAFARA
jgi:hypothetical protein